MPELVSGTVDLHCHPAPDIIPRTDRDSEVAEACQVTGQRGFVIKSHVGSTAERALLLQERFSDVSAIGSITLNRPVGGANPAAVEVAAQLGARVVWMPTLDSRTQRGSGTPPSGYQLPAWSDVHNEMTQKSGYGPAVEILTDGKIRSEIHDVLDIVAEHDMLLGTGHLDAEEVTALIESAIQHGISRIMVTHPDLPRQRIGIEEQREYARRGAYIERCLSAIDRGKVDASTTSSRIRDCGITRTVVTTDLGQVGGGSIGDGMRRWCELLTEMEFTNNQIRIMSAENPWALVK